MVNETNASLKERVLYHLMYMNWLDQLDQVEITSENAEKIKALDFTSSAHLLMRLYEHLLVLTGRNPEDKHYTSMIQWIAEYMFKDNTYHDEMHQYIHMRKQGLDIPSDHYQMLNSILSDAFLKMKEEYKRKQNEVGRQIVE